MIGTEQRPRITAADQLSIEPTTSGRRPVNVRSVALGLVGVVLIAGLAPYNDFVVGNTALIGSQLPTGLLLLLLLLILVVNAPLHRWRPRLALGAGELAVVLGMMLVACSIPSGGVMRYLPGNLTGLLTHASNEAEIGDLLRALDLPEWVFPATAEADPARRGNDPVVRDFAGRVPGVEDSFLARWRAVPWAAWARPALAWGALMAGLFGAVLCLMVIFRRQWVENERLPFPLAGVFLALIEPPEPGRALNALFRSRGFWVAAAAVFLVHGVNALHVYDPRHFPEIPVRYDLRAIMANEPWSWTEVEWFQTAKLYFTVVGLIFFIQTRVAFSLWFCFLAVQGVRMAMGARQQVLTGGMETDQTFGAVVPFAVAIVWVARHHLAVVVRQMFRGPARDEPRGRYLPYALAGWGFAASVGVVIAWLVAAGATLAGAVVLVAMALLIFLVLARIVAETGLPYVWLPVRPVRPWTYLLGELPAAAAVRTTQRSHFYTSLVGSVFTHDLRETLPAYVANSFRVADTAAYDGERNWRRAVPFTLCLTLALVTSYVVAGASMLYCEYAYAATLDQAQASPINGWGANGMPRWYVWRDALDYAPPGYGGHEPHSRVGHFAVGATLSTAMNVLRLRYDWWPLHPLGYVLAFTIGMRFCWFSVLVGWVAKVTVLKLGGADLFRRARAAFIGLIIGEAVAVACWLIVSLVCVTFGWRYHSVHILPT